MQGVRLLEPFNIDLIFNSLFPEDQPIPDDALDTI
jgi:hypothetical protein